MRAGTKNIFDQSKVSIFLANQRPEALTHRPAPQLRPMNGLRQHTALRTMRHYNIARSTGCVAQNVDRMHQMKPTSPISTLIVRRDTRKPTRKDMVKCRMLHKIAENAKKKRRVQGQMTKDEIVILPYRARNQPSQFKSSAHRTPPE